MIARFVWSQANKTQYDRDREPPVRVWHFGKDTPVIPISFLNLKWTRSWHPHSTRNSELLVPRIKKWLPSSIICDLYPYTCTRLSHSRFVIPSNSFPSEIGRNTYLELDEGILDQYVVDEDELINTMLSLLSGRSKVVMGLQERVIEVTDYCHSLGEMLSRGIDEFAMSTEPEDPD